MGAVNSSEDTKRYRDGYPGKEDDAGARKNLEFYANERKSAPQGDFVDVVHTEWWGEHDWLEQHHGYIQWLFPIREDGMNSRAQQLQLHEAAAIRADPVMRARVRKSYELMLDFYGMRLRDAETGELERADNWRPRYAHLNSSFHNYLRITRILKSLGELGYEHYKWPFLRHVLKEIYENRQLENCKSSCLRFWSQVLRNESEQREMRRVVNRYEGVDDDDDEDVVVETTGGGGGGGGDAKPRRRVKVKKKKAAAADAGGGGGGGGAVAADEGDGGDDDDGGDGADGGAAAAAADVDDADADADAGADAAPAAAAAGNKQ